MTKATEAAPTADDLYYELGSVGLGWVNCDRFLNSPQLLITFAINMEEPNAQLMLVFRGTRIIVDGVAMKMRTRIWFGRLPEGTEATLVAMRWERGQAYLATQATKVSAKPQVGPLQYRPVTMLGLQTALAQLD